MAKLAGPGTILCTEDYWKRLPEKGDYAPVGSFALRGFQEAIPLFVRPSLKIDSDKYLQPLIAGLNQGNKSFEGYRTVGRRLTTEFIRDFGLESVRPFTRSTSMADPV